MNAYPFVNEVEGTEDKYFYFQSFLKLIVYGYYQLRNSGEPYSRSYIHKQAKAKSNNPDAKNPIEDYLRNDLVSKYLNPNRHKFYLHDFLFVSGMEEYSGNILTGRLDIAVISPFLTADNIYFVFECKRLNKYEDSQNNYIKKGMERFTSRQYYSETEVNIAGMIAFVEIDAEKQKGGVVPVGRIAVQLKKKIDSFKDLLKTTQTLQAYKLEDQRYKEISDFKQSYLSKHIRSADKVEISIHHLLLDYYDILIS